MMLDRHPEIAIPLDVVGLWEKYYGSLATYNNLETESDVQRMLEDILQEDRIQLWEVPLSTESLLKLAVTGNFASIIEAFYKEYATAKGKTIWGDKDPGNMTRIHLLNEWFPTSKIIHIIRDGRDACLSHLEQKFGFDDILSCAEAWREEVRWVRRIGRILGPDRYMELKYEALVDEPVTLLSAICLFLDVPYNEAMLRYHEDVRGSIPESKRHIWPLISEPPTKKRVGRWKTSMSVRKRRCSRPWDGAKKSPPARDRPSTIKNASKSYTK